MAACKGAPTDALVVVPATTSIVPPTATSSPSNAPRTARGAAAYTFDGFRLGTPYASVASRAPYDKPCDDDPIDKRARRFMVYAAKPCKDLTFPEATSALFCIAYAEGREMLDQPIVAFGWLGGRYFDERCDFPLRTGERASRVAEVLGAPTSSFAVERNDTALRVQGHAGDLWAIVDGDVLAGFVVGPMPRDPESEQWRGLVQMYVRYTTRPSAR